MGLVREGMGPTLPELARRRFGLSARATVALVVGGIALLVAAAFTLLRPDDGLTQLVHRSAPAFTVLYDPSGVRPVRAATGELERFEGRARRTSATVTIRPLELPPFRGSVVYGQLPTFAETHLDRVRARSEAFLLRGEGRARVNRAPGYEVAYRTGKPGRRVFWREVFLLPEEEPDEGQAVHLPLRQARPGAGRLRPREAAFVAAAKTAFRSFRFGTERP